MSSPSTLEQFLISATGLPAGPLMELYHAGQPWPIWAAYNTYKAGLLAQAKGVSFAQALTHVEALHDSMANEMLASIAHSSISGDEKIHRLSSLPWLKAMQEHTARVAARTSASSQTVSSIFMAIQRYAFLHPGWELMNACMGRQPS